ncbi:MAG: amino acid permease [Propionibacteriaceae bacterium]|jgi:APA family basic amino acid/polyamine antiporter|nr:amino acid permease [Propionibacteriaceae bacterium]
MDLMRRRSIEASLAATGEPERHLKRTLGPGNLIVLGISVVVGAGIFSKAAVVSATQSGPAVIISFLIAGIVCALAALCYAEFASHIPVAGSAYTFSYASMGEFIAWIIGWDLILEMFFAAAVVTKAWGQYLDGLFQVFGWQTGSYADGTIAGIRNTIVIGGVECDVFNILLIAVLTCLVAFGTKLSANFSAVLTVIKVAIVLFIVVVGLTYFEASKLTPFVPEAVPTAEVELAKQSLFSVLTGAGNSTFGYYGVLAGAGTIFFAFIGFDVVATAAEETRNPKRNVPIGILGGLGVCLVLYVLVSIALSGMATPAELVAEAGTGAQATILTAFAVHGVTWPAQIIAVGIIVGLTTVVMVLLLGAVRIIFAMSRDGLLPRSMSITSGKTGTPVLITIGIGVIIAIASAFFPIDLLGDMVNIGTLSAFVLVSFGVPILRKRRREAPEHLDGYQVPFSPVLPVISGLACIWLMLQLNVETWGRFIIWLVIGLLIYFGYGYRNSQLQKHPEDIAKNYSHALVGLVDPNTELDDAEFPFAAEKASDGKHRQYGDQKPGSPKENPAKN